MKSPPAYRKSKGRASRQGRQGLGSEHASSKMDMPSGTRCEQNFLMRASDPFVGSSDMTERMRVFDWSRTPLGPVEQWPQSLRSALSICTGSRFPIAIYWGPDLTLLYNDAWSPIAGDKHPWALGRRGSEVWPEIWDSVHPLIAQVLASGESTYLEDALLLMHR